MILRAPDVIKLGEHGSDLYFPRARASEYSTERGQAYLLSKGPCRLYYIGSAEGHEYPDLQVGDEVNPRPVFIFSKI